MVAAGAAALALPAAVQAVARQAPTEARAAMAVVAAALLTTRCLQLQRMAWEVQQTAGMLAAMAAMAAAAITAVLLLAATARAAATSSSASALTEVPSIRYAVWGFWLALHGMRLCLLQPVQKPGSELHILNRPCPCRAAPSASYGASRCSLTMATSCVRHEQLRVWIASSTGLAAPMLIAEHGSRSLLLCCWRAFTVCLPPCRLRPLSLTMLPVR